MSKEEKQIERLKSLPNDYSYSEAKALAKRFGYEELGKGHTSGCGYCFTAPETGGRYCFTSLIPATL